MPNISISVKNKIAVQTNRTLYVCGNSDYTAIFDLDAEWNAFEIKTARFCYNGHYSDVVFTGNECEIPVIADTNEFEIGLFAGNLHTTTPAMVLCERSILSTSGTPTNPSPDVYHQLIEKINSGMLRGPQGEKGDPGKDAPQIDDGTISRDSPWSSRQIIEFLCPALEETGNPVTCYPVAGYPLGVVASWEPTQAGTGDPSPENIRPISGREAVTGAGQETWRFIALDGTEDWKQLRDYCETSFSGSGIPSSTDDITAARLSQHADRYIIDNPYTNTAADKCAWVYSTALHPYANLRIKHKTEQSTLEIWKAYLAAQYAAGTPVQIAYKLATPTPITATGAQPIQALAGCNTVLTDADSVAVTGRADPAHAIAALQAQLDTATQQLVETQAVVVDTTAAIVDYVFEQDCDAIGGGEDADAE